MNYYPFHIGDYVSATRHLSWAEDAAYRRLLDTYYTTEKPLPVELRAVCRLVLATTDEQREAVKVVLDEFFELTDDGWKNSRADAEICAMKDKQQKQREKANKRWAKPLAEHGTASAMPGHAELDAVASKTDADAMPPTPTPTPTPKDKSKNDPRSQSSPVVSKPDDVADAQWADYLALRRAKRAPLTQTALDGIAREAAKAGITLQSALETCCQRGWTGFKADWVAEQRQQTGSGTRPGSYHDMLTNAAATIYGTQGRAAR